MQLRGKWWEIYGDAQLNALEERIEVSSETLKQAQAQFLQARAAIGINRADLYPQVGVNPSISASNASNNRAQASSERARRRFPAAGGRVVRGGRVGPGARLP